MLEMHTFCEAELDVRFWRGIPSAKRNSMFDLGEGAKKSQSDALKQVISFFSCGCLQFKKSSEIGIMQVALFLIHCNLWYCVSIVMTVRYDKSQMIYQLSTRLLRSYKQRVYIGPMLVMNVCTKL